MKKLIQFGENVEGYEIPVLNEREIRAGAGILFLTLFMSWMFILFKQDFTVLKYGVTLFLFDLSIRVFINPKYSPILIIGRLIVSNQTPEYVGAKQKKFAWIIGISLSSILFIFMVLLNSYSPITGIACMVCLIFLFLESSFGICVGCKIYSRIYKEKAQLCPGEVCVDKVKQPIQRTSKGQYLIVVGFIVFFVLTGLMFNDWLSLKPLDMFGVYNK
ncbi:MAG: DUF4395 domain-containing protein [Spirochaetota bacterium]|nr:DUF4395 domain-containing protein [Spirochaetota bacterium]